jgi:hypothetical protein
MFARYPFWLHLWLHRTLHGGHHRRATVAGQPGSGFSCSHFKYKNPMRSERIGFFVEKTSIPLWLGTTTAPSELRDLDCRANFAIWIAERTSRSGLPSELRDLDCRANFAIWIAERTSRSGLPSEFRYLDFRYCTYSSMSI